MNQSRGTFAKNTLDFWKTGCGCKEVEEPREGSLYRLTVTAPAYLLLAASQGYSHLYGNCLLALA